VKRALYDRFFPDLDAVQQDAQVEVERRKEARRELVTRDAYREDIKEWLEAQIKRHRPKPGDETSLIYQVGVSDGLYLVKEHLEMLEHEATR
jgi:hypothetical protein